MPPPSAARGPASSWATCCSRRCGSPLFFGPVVSDEPLPKEHVMSSRARTLWTFAITSAALFMVVLDNLVVTTALPTIQRSRNASIQDLEWTVNAYHLPFAVLLLPGAALGDRFGRRRMFVVGLALFTASSAA